MYAIGEHNFVIDAKIWKKMCLDREFTQWAKENGIRNPFEAKIMANKEMPTQEEIDNYMSMREEYVKRRLAEEGIKDGEENL